MSYSHWDQPSRQVRHPFIVGAIIGIVIAVLFRAFAL